MLKKLLLLVWVFLPLLSFGQSCPQVLSPAPGSTNVPVDATITWTEIIGVPNYVISIGTTPGGRDIVSEVSVGINTSFTPPLGLPENTEIFVTITLSFFANPNDNVVCPSISFRTRDVTTPPGCTMLNLPEDGDIDVNIRTNLRWDFAPGATSYLLRIGTTMNGGEILPQTDVGNVLRYDPPVDFPGNTEIFVQVIPVNENGQPANCPIESFMTADVAQSLDCSRLLFPINGATNVPLTPLLQWEEVAGATGYRVSIGTTPGGTDILNEGIFQDTSTFVIDFTPNTLLFVTIVPFNDAVEATGCVVESFATSIGCGPFFDPTIGDFVSFFPELDFPDNFNICEDSGPLELTTNTIAQQYRWTRISSIGGSELEVLSETEMVEIERAGFYRLEVTDFAGPAGDTFPCSSSQDFEVQITESADIRSVNVDTEGESLVFTINVSGNGDYEFALNDIDGPYQDSNIFRNAPLGNNTVFVRDRDGN